ncbi:endolytic transglycosylase MltG [bacterium]|nr:endolytic transglycosylase MltG [bacterium]
MKKLKTLLIIDAILIVIVTVLSLMLVGLYSVNSTISDTDTRDLTIPKGISTVDIAELSAREGLIKSKFQFLIWAKLLGKDKYIQAGNYHFDAPLSLYSYLNSITHGGSFAINVTIPEGLNIYQIGGLLNKELDIDSLEFLGLAQDSVFIASLGIPNLTAEGFLFPETYNFDPGVSAEKVIKVMYDQFLATAETLIINNMGKFDMTIHDIVTLASIIEEEAHVKYEQPIISGVYHNRLKLGMLLQADPTTIYAMKKFDKPLLTRDLDFDSPYNTYQYNGIPPGPISNPGIDAIKAALFPEETKYLYFVSNRDGTHVFSETSSQHHKAVREIKEKLKKSESSQNKS